MKPTIGVIGLGIMGGAMAEALHAGAYQVVGYDVRAEARRRLQAAGGRPLRSSAAVAASADVVITSLATVAALDDAAEKIAAAKRPKSRPGLIVIETSTLPIEDKQRALRRLKRAGITLLDCPISGTGAQAAAKDAIVYVSGDRAAYQRNRAVFEGFARNSYYCGSFGAGSKLKYIANLLVTIHNLSAAEAFVLAEQAGLDLNLMHRVIGDGAGGSRMFQVRGPMMASRHYLPATMKVDVYKKDTSIIDEFAKALRCPTPLFAISKRYHDAAMKKGYAKLDTAVVHRLLRDEARDRKSVV
jgi:L-threonate 2-dehydrogenase